MFVEFESPSTKPHHPRDPRGKLMLARLFIHGFLLVRIFGFSGASLIQKDSENDVGGHLQEFALPFLKGRLQKMRGKQVIAE